MAFKRDARSDVEQKSTTPPPPLFSRPWMQPFLNDAMACADVVGASKRAGVSLSEVRSARGADTSFGLAMLDVDACVRLAIVGNLEAKAAAGETRATSLLLRRSNELKTLAGDGPGDEEEMHPKVAEACLRAALETVERLRLKDAFRQA